MSLSRVPEIFQGQSGGASEPYDLLVFVEKQPICDKRYEGTFQQATLELAGQHGKAVNRFALSRS